MSLEDKPKIETDEQLIAASKLPTVGFYAYEQIGGMDEADAVTVLEAAKTDEADTYRHSQGNKPPKLTSFCWTIIPVLHKLYGLPWNNHTLNWVTGLAPSVIRVIDYGGCITCDALTGRVTVYLEKDNRTIREIEQEVRVGTIGCHNGYDLNCQLEYLRTRKTLAGYTYKQAGVICNTAALERVDFGESNGNKDQKEEDKTNT